MIPTGFEPVAYCLEGSCSIQLSYGTKIKWVRQKCCKSNTLSFMSVQSGEGLSRFCLSKLRSEVFTFADHLQTTPMNLTHWKDDLPASFVVFLVALPLCLGIAVASGASPIAGLISGIVGGIVIGFLSGSELSVSGPAAGLTAIVYTAITSMESYEMFLLAVVVAGIMQVVFYFLKAGIIGYYFPNAVIKGMLAAIGLILILKQIPHALGYHESYEGDISFQTGEGNTFTEIMDAFRYADPGAVIISMVALGILILFERPFVKGIKAFKILPGALFAVLSGVGINALFATWMPEWFLSGKQLVNIPVPENTVGLLQEIRFPDFKKAGEPAVYITGFTIALVASIESLLSLEASDKLDPLKRVSPPSRELGAQGIGNILSGLIGGIPVTAVIVRSSANINTGAKTKLSAILHGIWLLLALVFIANLLNYIPLAALAAILLLIGYKLARPSLFRDKYKKGKMRFIPFVVTILAILFTDLLIGIGIGLVVGIIFVLKSNVTRCMEVENKGNQVFIRFVKDATFIHKAMVLKALSNIPVGADVHIDASQADFVDLDIAEAIQTFADVSRDRGIQVSVEGVKALHMPRQHPSLHPRMRHHAEHRTFSSESPEDKS